MIYTIISIYTAVLILYIGWYFKLKFCTNLISTICNNDFSCFGNFVLGMCQIFNTFVLVLFVFDVDNIKNIIAITTLFYLNILGIALIIIPLIINQAINVREKYIK